MNISFWISKKLRLNAKSGGANATGIVIAVVGIAIAVIIMEFTIAIVLGFKHQITGRIMGFDSQLWVTPEYLYNEASQAGVIEPDSQLLEIVEQVFPDSRVSMRFSQPGLLKTDSDFAGLYFTGFDNNHDTSFEKGNIVSGEYPDYNNPDNDNLIVISTSTARSLGLGIKDKINACFFVDEAIKSRKFEIAGIYETGFGDYDRTIVYSSINSLRRIAGADSVAGTRMSVLYDFNEESIENDAATLQNALLAAYRDGSMSRLYPVDNVMHTGATYFNWLSLLDTNVVVIFILMLCVSGFTLISSMFIIILERIPTIGILRALGARKKLIRRIFVNIMMKIVGLGLLIGNVIGLGLLFIQQEFRPIHLDPETYYLKYVPVEIDAFYMILLNIGVIFAAWLILILPSRLASSVSPAVTMRFE